VALVVRFCRYVVRRGSVRIRQYGLLSNRDRGERLGRWRALLGMVPVHVEPQPPGSRSRLVVGWWLWAWLLLSSGSAELLAAGVQALALSATSGSDETCAWCGSCRWETLWQAERPRGAGAGRRGRRGYDSS